MMIKIEKDIWKIFTLATILIFNFGCSSSQTLVAKENINVEKEKIKETVEKFLATVKNNETDKAMEDFFLKEDSKNNFRKDNEKPPLDFNWANFLFNRNLFNEEIKDAKVNNDEGYVVVKLGDNDKVHLNGKFLLRKIDGNWKIAFIEF